MPRPTRLVALLMLLGWIVRLINGSIPIPANSPFCGDWQPGKAVSAQSVAQAPLKSSPRRPLHDSSAPWYGLPLESFKASLAGATPVPPALSPEPAGPDLFHLPRPPNPARAPT